MKTSNFKKGLLKELKAPESAAAYLAQALESGEQADFLIALRDVVEAGGGASAIARQAHIQRESLYKALSSRGNPRLTTLQGVLKSVGLRLIVTHDAPRNQSKILVRSKPMLQKRKGQQSVRRPKKLAQTNFHDETLGQAVYPGKEAWKNEPGNRYTPAQLHQMDRNWKVQVQNPAAPFSRHIE